MSTELEPLRNDSPVADLLYSFISEKEKNVRPTEHKITNWYYFDVTKQKNIQSLGQLFGDNDALAFTEWTKKVKNDPENAKEEINTVGKATAMKLHALFKQSKPNSVVSWNQEDSVLSVTHYVIVVELNRKNVLCCLFFSIPVIALVIFFASMQTKDHY